MNSQETIARLMHLEDEAHRLQKKIRDFIVLLREGLDNEDSE